MTTHDVIELVAGSFLTVMFSVAASAFGSIGKRLMALELAMEKRVTFAELGKTAERLYEAEKNNRERLAVLEDWRKSQ